MEDRPLGAFFQLLHDGFDESEDLSGGIGIQEIVDIDVASKKYGVPLTGTLSSSARVSRRWYISTFFAKY